MSANPRKKKSKPAYDTRLFLGKVAEKEGKRILRLNSSALWNHYLTEVCRLDDHISLLATNKRPKRTLCQNSYLHLYMSLIGLSTGYTMEELKSWYKQEVLSKGVSEVFGRRVRVVRSSADLNISEFMDLIDRMQELTGIPAPDTAPFKLPMFLEEYRKKKEKQEADYRIMSPKI